MRTLHCPALFPRSCSSLFPGGTRSVSTIVAAASMSSFRSAIRAIDANLRFAPVSYSSCVSLHLNEEIMRIVYYAPRNMPRENEYKSESGRQSNRDNRRRKHVGRGEKKTALGLRQARKCRIVILHLTLWDLGGFIPAFNPSSRTPQPRRRWIAAASLSAGALAKEDASPPTFLFSQLP